MAALGRNAGRRSCSGIYGSAEGRGANRGRAYIDNDSGGRQFYQRNSRQRNENEMSMGVAPTSPVGDISNAAAEQWHKLLKARLRTSPKLTENFYAELRDAKLTFGNRVHCPFLRPFFLSPDDEQRVRAVAETMANLAERVTDAAIKDAALLAQFHLRAEELRLVRLGKIAGPASTSSHAERRASGPVPTWTSTQPSTTGANRAHAFACSVSTPSGPQSAYLLRIWSGAKKNVGRGPGSLQASHDEVLKLLELMELQDRGRFETFGVESSITPGIAPIRTSTSAISP